MNQSETRHSEIGTNVGGPHGYPSREPAGTVVVWIAAIGLVLAFCYLAGTVLLVAWRFWGFEVVGP